MQLQDKWSQLNLPLRFPAFVSTWKTLLSHLLNNLIQMELCKSLLFYLCIVLCTPLIYWFPKMAGKQRQRNVTSRSRFWKMCDKISYDVNKTHWNDASILPLAGSSRKYTPQTKPKVQVWSSCSHYFCALLKRKQFVRENIHNPATRLWMLNLTVLSVVKTEKSGCKVWPRSSVQRPHSDSAIFEHLRSLS